MAQLARYGDNLHTLLNAKAGGQRNSLHCHGNGKSLRLESRKYISRLLTILPELFVKDPKAAVDDLVPWGETVQRLC